MPTETKVIAVNSGISRFIGLVFAIFTGVVGHQIHGSVFWAVVDVFFCFFAWLKWLLCGQVNVTIIKAAFAHFLS